MGYIRQRKINNYLIKRFFTTFELNIIRTNEEPRFTLLGLRELEENRKLLV